MPRNWTAYIFLQGARLLCLSAVVWINLPVRADENALPLPREQQIQELKAVVNSAKAAKDYETLKRAMSQLGGLKALEATDFIIENISVASPEEAAKLWPGCGIPTVKHEDVFPAMMALRQTGPSAATRLLDAVANGRINELGIQIAQRVLCEWYRSDLPTGIKLVQNYAIRCKDAESKARLLPLLEYLQYFKHFDDETELEQRKRDLLPEPAHKK